MFWMVQYCECYGQGIKCTTNCVCEDCGNGNPNRFFFVSDSAPWPQFLRVPEPVWVQNMCVRACACVGVHCVCACGEFVVA